MGQNFYAASNPVSQGSELAVHWDLDGWQRFKVNNKEKSWGEVWSAWEEFLWQV